MKDRLPALDWMREIVMIPIRRLPTPGLIAVAVGTLDKVLVTYPLCLSHGLYRAKRPGNWMRYI